MKDQVPKPSTVNQKNYSKGSNEGEFFFNGYTGLKNTGMTHKKEVPFFKSNNNTSPIQPKLRPNKVQSSNNNTGLPKNLKSSIENLSGYSLDDVKVHYNSDKPEQLQAHAYAQGTDIHMAAGQEKHLPHETWHVVQQKQGRVKPRIQAKVVAINDDEVLECEADIMSKAAMKAHHSKKGKNPALQMKHIGNHHLLGNNTRGSMVVQRKLKKPRKIFGEDKKLNKVFAYVKKYNALPENEKEAPHRLHYLQMISRQLYTWYNSQKTYDIGGLDSRIAKEVREFEIRVEAEISKVLGTASTKFAPINTSKLEGKEEESVDRVWEELLNGKGNLKIVGSPEFHEKVRSMLFRILNTKIGRKLVIQIVLNSNKKPVIIGEGDPPDEIKNLLPESYAKESKAIPQIYDDEASREKEEVSFEELTEMKKIADPENPGDFFKVKDVKDWQTAIYSDAKGIKVGEDPDEIFYKFAKGAKGVYIALVENKESLDSQGLDKKSIHTPAFVTLAHEMTHALNQLAGATSIGIEELFKLFGGGDEGVGTYEDPGPSREKWSNVEELFTILGVENAIRKEVGLAKRGAHAAALDPILVEKLNEEKQLIGAFFGVITELEAEQFKKGKKGQEGLVKEVFNLYDKTIKNLSQREKQKRVEEYEKIIKKVAKGLKKGEWDKVIKKLKNVSEGKYLEILKRYLPKLAE